MTQDVQRHAGAADAASAKQDDGLLHLTMRRQECKTTGRIDWLVVEQEVAWRPQETAIIVVDVWDKHWSWGAEERANVLAPRVDTVLRAARARGVQIIHAPSDIVDFYNDDPARRWVCDLPHVAAPVPGDRPDPPLPIDDSDGGSDTGEQTEHYPWTRQHPAIEIAAGDAISADGHEIYNILAHKSIDNVIYVGVHANRCVLRRSFGIKRMVHWRSNVVLARDLTDAMYNPLKPPYVSHDAGTQLVIGYIEKFWCPTISSDDLTAPRR